jgi:ankyrin repeat protein
VPKSSADRCDARAELVCQPPPHHLAQGLFVFATPEFQQFLKALRCEFYKSPKLPGRELAPEDRQHDLEKNKSEARRLIKASSNQRQIQSDGWIHHKLAKERYWLDLIQDLLEAGHDPNLEDPDGFTALDLALKKNVELHWIESLLLSGATFGRGARKLGWWRSVRAYQDGDLRAFTKIIQALSSTQKNRFQEPSNRGQNALDWYLSAKQELPLQEIDALWRAGLRMSQPRETIEAALAHRPLSSRPLAWLRSAVASGLSQEYRNIFSFKERFALRLIQDLLDNTQQRPTPLIEEILHQQASVSEVSWASASSERLSDGTTPLMLALYPEPQLEVVRALLHAGAQANAKRNDGLTALMILSASPSQKHQLEAMELLLRAGANINESESREEMTPLLFAIREGESMEKIKLLLTKGALLNPPRRDGKTAEDFAKTAGKDLRAILQSISKQCAVKLIQPKKSYYAEDMIRGTLHFSTLFDLGTVSFTVKSQWRPINSQDWRESHTETFSGSIEIKANQKKQVSFELRAPTGPFSHEQGHRVNDWQLEVTLTSPENVTLVQSGDSEFTLSRAVEAIVGTIPERDKEVQREAISRLTQKNNPSMGEHTFTHEDYQIRLVLERDSYRIGETLRGEVRIESKAKVSCTKHEVLLQQYIIDQRTGDRTKIATFTPQIDFESPWYREKSAWPQEGHTKCSFSMTLPMLTPSYVGKSFQVEWVVFFEAHIPWALNPTVYRRVSISAAQEPPEELPTKAPEVLWPKGAAGAWYSRKKPMLKRWEELGASLLVSPLAVERGAESRLSLSLNPTHEVQLKSIQATLLGAERGATESLFEVSAEDLWRRDERTLSNAIHLPAGHPLVIEERFLIPPDAPASFTSTEWCFSWWILVELSFSEEEPIRVALLLDVLPVVGVGAPFRS